MLIFISQHTYYLILFMLRPYWINYKFLKKKINEISEAKGGIKITDQNLVSNPGIISKSSCEVEFFRLLRKELKKTSDFFTNTEAICRIRKERIWKAYTILSDTEVLQDRNSWTRLLMACVKFYKDVLLLENYAIMNYCGFSKILKKHDKLTGWVREWSVYDWVTMWYTYDRMLFLLFSHIITSIILLSFYLSISLSVHLSIALSLGMHSCATWWVRRTSLITPTSWTSSRSRRSCSKTSRGLRGRC